MADQPRGPDADGRSAAAPDRDSPPRMPRWVWLSVVIGGVLIVLAVVVLLVSGGQHGPGRHPSSSGSSIPTVDDADRLPSLASAHG